MIKQIDCFTSDYYEILLEQQKGCCTICLKTESRKGAPHLSVDHNHKTGDIRGLLCSKCNIGLGYFNDDKTLLKKAIDYL
jgi:hypothetical protein